MTWPWHSGQSGQPMPEPVARTTTPTVTSRIVATTVARASFWKRVTGGASSSGGMADAAGSRGANGAARPFYAVAGAGRGHRLRLRWRVSRDSRRPSRRARRRRASLAAIVVAACVLVVVGVRRRARRPAGGLRPSAARQPERHPGHRQLPAGRRARTGSCSRSSTPPTNLPAASPGPHGVRRVHRARARRSPGTADPGDVRVGDRGRRAASTSPTRTSRRPATGRPCSSPRRRARRRRRSASGSRSPTTAPTVAVGEQAPASTTPTAADVGGDLAKLSTDPKPDPAFYQLSVADALARAASRSCWCSRRRRSARAPSAARRSTGSRRSRPAPPDGRRVHQRRAVPARVHGGPPPARARREQPAPAGRVGRTSGASCPSRGSSRSTATGSSAARSRAWSARTSCEAAIKEIAAS